MREQRADVRIRGGGGERRVVVPAVARELGQGQQRVKKHLSAILGVWV